VRKSKIILTGELQARLESRETRASIAASLGISRSGLYWYLGSEAYATSKRELEELRAEMGRQMAKDRQGRIDRRIRRSPHLYPHLRRPAFEETER
jgi:AcrR family transcriptional regulator